MSEQRSSTPAKPISLEKLAAAVGGTCVVPSGQQGDQAAGRSTPVRGIAHDSRSVTPGALFGCVVGQRHDGHRFAAEALSGGAAALLVSQILDVDVPQIVVPDVRAALGPGVGCGVEPSVAPLPGGGGHRHCGQDHGDARNRCHRTCMRYHL